jgi:hypothetical protein
MDIEKISKVVKVALYIGASAAIDYLISATTDSQFGVLTPFINLLLVTVRQAFKKAD